ncbi:hypothetical protein BpHYR1_028062 [Brachionus plicatilis]|uniref:Uncharacterized protein n=1 Tax=Brachionus plicatilis TaxID=10195 RepID=A0A3M7SP68_BRAPC|nr:hypothetical protein BpHYR1_028062 [Brachionus plicatilis]
MPNRNSFNRLVDHIIYDYVNSTQFKNHILFTKTISIKKKSYSKSSTKNQICCNLNETFQK